MIGSESAPGTHLSGINDAKTLRRVLVVAYYFPPMGLSGVQRVAKFVKYLPDYGWQPTVLTVEPAGYFAYDTTLLHEVEQAGVAIHRTKTWDPTRLFGGRRTVALPSEFWRRRLSSLSQFFFVPDNKISWMRHALRAGNRLLQAHPFDAVFSSAPPYTAHLVAERLSRRHGLPLVVDFRDDWVGNPRHVYPTPFHRRWHQRLEQRVLRRSRYVVTINEPIRSALRQRNPCLDGSSPIAILPQGYDPDDFAVEPVAREPETMWLLYSGIFYDAQTPDFFLRALAQGVEKLPEMRRHVEAVFVGLLPRASLQLIDRLGIGDLVRYEGYVAHDEAVAFQRAADVLWMTIGKRPGAEGISTGKLFEYIGTRKPILALVPPGAAREALGPYGAACVVEPDDVAAIEQAILGFYDRWRAGSLPEPEEAYVRQFDRRRLAGLLAGFLTRSLEDA
jgi:glycosyltransferase involved in cell wall biosynthesis